MASEFEKQSLNSAKNVLNLRPMFLIVLVSIPIPLINSTLIRIYRHRQCES